MNNKRFGSWQLKSQRANLRWQAMELEIDLSNPAGGAMFNGNKAVGAQRLFCIPQVVVAAAEKIDPYARGSDLIVAYPCTAARQIGTEVYWRWTKFPGVPARLAEEYAENESQSVTSPAAESEENLVGCLELIYSMQTDLLETQPNPRVESNLVGRSLQFYAVDESGKLVLLENANRSEAVACLIEQEMGKILLAVMPSDLDRLIIAPADSSKENADLKNYEIRCELNSPFLEKGVIRRARLFAAFVDSENEPQLLAAANHFFNSEIPLTA